MSPPPTTRSRPIVFFDGVCGLCNASVDVLLRVDRHERLMFAPLQGDTAARLLQRAPDAPMDSIVLFDADGAHERTAALLRICQILGGPWRLWLVFWIVPRPLRDAVYSFIAKNRYAWFGEKSSCRMPTAAERTRFLD